MELKTVVLGLLLFFSICCRGETGKADVVKITDGNWRQTLDGEWLIKFYAPWCPACKAIAPTWIELSEWSQELDTKIAEVDVTEEPGLSGRFAVTSLPTIYHAKDGVFRRYLGPRTKDELITLVEDKKYAEIEPVAGWQSPNSISMTILSWVFKMSMLVRVTHSILTEDYGFPAWSSYGFFAVVTIMLGLFLGMILVFIADCFWPVKPREKYQRPPPVPVDGGKKDEEEEAEEEVAGENDEIDAGQAEGRGDGTVRKRKIESEPTSSEKAS
ncbi:thioredoxin-related transmembrane protein 1-like [Diadema antillarum]|uniref:thioredoxin-related transmembrane protein 1-like n=1 Tax=Diadema antillarum TaxID=105358 RepID=UPI003A8521E7